MKSALITGGAGFIGSNFIRCLLRHDSAVRVVNLDALTYAGNPENLSDLERDPRYQFVKGDIRDRALLRDLFERHRFDTVVNFAAESHVDRSIVEPERFLETNVGGALALLEEARRAWNTEPDNKYSRAYLPGARYLQVSTDEVYGALGESGLFTEETPLAPNSPYSASKAGADLMTRAFRETYGLPVNITRCSNNYGPYQFPEKLIPLMIHNCMRNQPLPIYGNGLQIRDWIYVEDHCAAILAVLEKGKSGEVYNIGGRSERTNLEIVRRILREMGKGEELIEYVRDRPGHDRRYAIDDSKIRTQLGWKPARRFEDGLRETIAWYLSHQDWMERVTSGEYRKYYAEMYRSGLA